MTYVTYALWRERSKAATKERKRKKEEKKKKIAENHRNNRREESGGMKTESDIKRSVSSVSGIEEISA